MPKKISNHQHHSHGSKNSQWFWIKSTILVLLFIYFVLLNIIQPSGPIKWTWHWGIWLPLTSYVIFWEGREYFKIYKLILRRSLSMDTLVGLASHILFIYSIVMIAMNATKPMYSYDLMWEGSAVLILFTNIGHHIQETITSSSLEVYNKLNSMKNQEVLVERNGNVVKVKVSDVKVGEIIVIQRGESVPLDGLVLEDGRFDYSNITGESKEVFHQKNDFVLSGSFNVGNNLRIKVSKNSNDSTINHIIEKIEDVSATRPPMQQLADKVLKYFIPSVLSIALITSIIWLVIGLTGNIHVPWIKHSNPWELAIEAGVTTLAIACPCALGIATPLVYTVSSMLAAKHGILINNPKALEEINRIKIFAFDKTGTITSDEMDIVKVWGDDSFLGIASGLEQNIKHPIAKAINAYAEPIQLNNIRYIENTGVIGELNNRQYEIKKYDGTKFDVNLQNTVIGLYENNQPVLVFEIANKIKPMVKETIASLHKLKIKTVMITGDKYEVAKHIADQINIDQIFAEVNPLNKAEIIEELQKQGKVAFVGDGFNDAIAIKKANLSLAFAKGSDITNSLSDASIIADDFYEIISFIKLGRMNKVRVKLSLTYAFAFNVIAIPIAILLLVQPWVGAAIMAISDILVALNALIYKIIGIRRLRHNAREEKHEH